MPAPGWDGSPRFYQALAISALLHLMLVVLIQPARFTGPSEVVLEARLVPVQATTPPAELAETPPAPSPTPASAEAVSPSEPPSPASPTPTTVPPQDNRMVLPPSGEPRAEPVTKAAATRDASPDLPLPEVPLLVDTRWYTAREVERRPEPLGEILPVYPEEARRRGIEGSVVVALHIDEAGEVQEIEVLESNPPGVFDAAVIAAYGQARFQPAARGGRPVRYLGRYRVLFELE